MVNQGCMSLRTYSSEYGRHVARLHRHRRRRRRRRAATSNREFKKLLRRRRRQRRSKNEFKFYLRISGYS